MIVLIVFIVALALPLVWLFAKTKPSTTRVDALRRFNALTWFAALFAGSAVWIYTSSQIAGNRSHFLAIVGCVAVGSTVLLVGALVRFLVFRRPH